MQSIGTRFGPLLGLGMLAAGPAFAQAQQAPNLTGHVRAGTLRCDVAAATAGVGGAVNVLVGGSNRGITLQPVSVEGNTGLNIALGVAELKLAAVR